MRLQFADQMGDLVFVESLASFLAIPRRRAFQPFGFHKRCAILRECVSMRLPNGLEMGLDGKCVVLPQLLTIDAAWEFFHRKSILPQDGRKNYCDSDSKKTA